MTIFVYFILPETKGIAIDEKGSVWRSHWFGFVENNDVEMDQQLISLDFSLFYFVKKLVLFLFSIVVQT